jgi:hypothetical protein
MRVLLARNDAFASMAAFASVVFWSWLVISFAGYVADLVTYRVSGSLPPPWRLPLWLITTSVAGWIAFRMGAFAPALAFPARLPRPQQYDGVELAPPAPSILRLRRALRLGAPLGVAGLTTLGHYAELIRPQEIWIAVTLCGIAGWIVGVARIERLDRALRARGFDAVASTYSEKGPGDPLKKHNFVLYLRRYPAPPWMMWCIAAAVRPLPVVLVVDLYGSDARSTTAYLGASLRLPRRATPRLLPLWTESDHWLLAVSHAMHVAYAVVVDTSRYGKNDAGLPVGILSEMMTMRAHPTMAVFLAERQASVPPLLVPPEHVIRYGFWTLALSPFHRLTLRSNIRRLLMDRRTLERTATRLRGFVQQMNRAVELDEERRSGIESDPARRREFERAMARMEEGGTLWSPILGPGLELDVELMNLVELGDEAQASSPLIRPPRTWAVFIDGVHAVDATWTGKPALQFAAVGDGDPFGGVQTMMMVASCLNPAVDRLLAGLPPPMHPIALNHLLVNQLPDLFWSDHEAKAVPVRRKGG